MKPKYEQLFFIDKIEKNFGINYIDYGFYSNGSISVNCKDEFVELAITGLKNGKIK